MKKLVMMAAIVCAAAATQAAAVNWTTGVNALINGTGTQVTGIDGYTLVLCNLGQTFNYENAEVISTKSTDAYNTTMTINSSGTRTGRVTGKVSFTYVDGVNDDVINGDYLVLMAKNNKTGDLVALSYANGTQVGEEGAVKVSGITQNSSSMTTTQGTMGLTGNFTVAVPEPTSAMLLLLGMAGLALRRRRA